MQACYVRRGRMEDGDGEGVELIAVYRPRETRLARHKCSKSRSESYSASPPLARPVVRSRFNQQNSKIKSTFFIHATS